MSNNVRRWAVALAAAIAACSTARPPLPSPGPPAEPVLAPSVHEPRAGEEAEALDLDGDGVPDTWTYSVAAPDGARAVARRERDLDGDGRTDVWEDLAGGRVALRALDLDGDGRPDLALRYDARGELAVKEYAFGADGRPRVRASYERGGLVRRDRDRDGDGKPDAWESWIDGELDEVSASGEPTRRRPSRQK